MAFIDAVANGNISPCRFVSMATDADPASSQANSFKVIEDIIVAQPIVGVSQEGTDFFPSSDTVHYQTNAYAAVAGENIKVFGPGEQCLVELGDTVHAGKMLKANATTNGKAVEVDMAGTTATPQFVGAIALQSGVSGEKIRVLVLPMVYTYHA